MLHSLLDLQPLPILLQLGEAGLLSKQVGSSFFQCLIDRNPIERRDISHGSARHKLCSPRLQRLIPSTGRGFVELQLSQARIGPLAGYREVFQCPVDFEQAFSGVLLANAQLDAPLPQANAQLAQAHQQQAAARLAALSRQDGLEQTLRMWIASQLQGQAPARAQAARALGLSERTLARRMRAEGLSYSALLDGVRRDAALQAVAQTTRALSDIALALGYAEPSVFTRAFRRWTGATPGHWRSRGAADMRAQPPAA